MQLNFNILKTITLSNELYTWKVSLFNILFYYFLHGTLFETTNDGVHSASEGS